MRLAEMRKKTMARATKGDAPIGRREDPTRGVTVLTVRLGDRLVGTLTRLADDSVIFTFDPRYVTDEARPTLSLGFKTPSGGLVKAFRPSRGRLLPFFSNLLPEDPLRRYLAERGGVHPDREFFLLWLLGLDLPGALVIEPPDGETLPPPSFPQEAIEREGGGPLRFSLAGVQLKFSAVMEATGGLTLPLGGVGGTWIAKLPSPRYPGVPENEFAMMSLAASAGIEVPAFRLVPTAEIGNLPQGLPEAFGTSYVVERFDRDPVKGRIHCEDFAQIFGLYPTEKYERASYHNIAEVVWREIGEAGIAELVRRLAFNVLIGNGDAHVKNWSLLYPDGRTPCLSPAYDLVSTVPYIPQDRLALSLGGTKEFADVTLATFRRWAEKIGLPSRLVVKIAEKTAAAVRELWPTHSARAVLPMAIRNAVDAHLARMKL